MDMQNIVPNVGNLSDFGRDEMETGEGRSKGWEDVLQPMVVLFVFTVSPIIIVVNVLLLAAIRGYKRLHTPSNCFLVSLALSDLGVGIALPVGLYSRLTNTGPCLLILCAFISLCNASVVSNFHWPKVYGGSTSQSFSSKIVCLAYDI